MSYFISLPVIIFTIFSSVNASSAPDAPQFNLMENEWGNIQRFSKILGKSGINNEIIDEIVIKERRHLKKDVTADIEDFPALFQSLLNDEKPLVPMLRGGNNTHTIISHQYVSQEMLDKMKENDFSVHLLSCPENKKDISWYVYEVSMGVDSYTIALCLNKL